MNGSCSNVRLVQVYGVGARSRMKNLMNQSIIGKNSKLFYSISIYTIYHVYKV